jgi:hypothetical protein
VYDNVTLNWLNEIRTIYDVFKGIKTKSRKHRVPESKLFHLDHLLRVLPIRHSNLQALNCIYEVDILVHVIFLLILLFFLLMRIKEPICVAMSLPHLIPLIKLLLYYLASICRYHPLPAPNPPSIIVVRGGDLSTGGGGHDPLMHVKHTRIIAADVALRLLFRPLKHQIGGSSERLRGKL